MGLFTAGKFRAFDAKGIPLAGGKVFTYKAGSNDPKETFTDFTLGEPNANPVILDANGEANIWLRGVYKIILKDANDIQQWSTDNIDQRYNVIENASVVDYGAVGDGITDDTQAFQDALADNNGSVFVPAGNFYLTDTIQLNDDQMLYGAGAASILQFRSYPLDKGELPVSYDDSFNGVWISGSYNTLKDLTIVGPNAGIIMKGQGRACVQNLVDNVTVWDAICGVRVDGGDDTNYPTYWNELHHVLVERPRDNGVLLTTEPGGDTPNANKFRDVRVYSHAQPMSNDKIGFNIDAGRYGNAFVDCEANLHPNATACMRFGDVTGQNYVVNFTAECLGGAHGIWMDTGSGAGDDGFMSFMNYFHATAGSSIFVTDTGTKNYHAINAGFPDRFFFGGQARMTNALIEQLNFESEFIDVSPAADQVPTSQDVVHLLSSNSGPFNFDLPAPGDATGRFLIIKKLDLTQNVITIRRQDDHTSGPDNRNYQLISENDFALCYCNGAEWSLLGGNHPRQESKFYDTSVTGTTLTDLDPDIYFHLISPLANTTVTLRSASDARSVGKTTTIKRNSAGSTNLTVHSIEGFDVELFDQNDYITVYSNGAQWFIIAERRTF